jgi:hypothetical protein
MQNFMQRIPAAPLKILKVLLISINIDRLYVVQERKRIKKRKEKIPCYYIVEKLRSLLYLNEKSALSANYT